ncbi:MAG: PH domain-containing protein [Streptomycetales bacterium]
MGFPTRRLSEDESFEFEVHPHAKALVPPTVLVVLAPAVASFLAARVPGGDGQTGLRLAIGAATLVVLVRWALLPWLGWVTTTYAATNRRLVVRVGVLAREGRDIPLGRITDISFFHRSLLDRLLGCGTVVVQAGGERGQVVLADVPGVERRQRDLHRLVEDDEMRRRRDAYADGYDGYDDHHGYADYYDGGIDGA